MNTLRWAINNTNTYYKNYENKILEQCFLHKKSSSGVGYKNFFKGKPSYIGNVNIMYICWIPFCILISSNYIIFQLQRSQMYIIAPVQLGYTVTVKLTKYSKHTSHNGPCNNMSPQSSVDGWGTLSSCTLLVSATSRFSLQRSSKLIKSQPITTHCKRTFKTTLEIQALVQYLYDMFQFVKKLVTRTVDIKKKQSTDHMQASPPTDKLWLRSFLKIPNVKSLYKNLNNEITI